MNRKTKIIVSVVGIVIVTLALLGITYAYYLTRIEGNTNTNSISLTTANLLLKYDDGSGAIVEENIMPGRTFTKTFSVTNEGNATIDNYVVYLEDVINDLSRKQDLTYTLTCDNCSGSSGVYPKLASIIATNSIEVGQTHNYTLTVVYENLTDTDQSVDMGSTINGYIQIYNLTDIVDITGNVTNSQDGDYVQINSVQKISQIVDGKYLLSAIEPGSHTITVRYKDSNGEEQIRSTKDIVIQKGNETGVSGNVITVTNDSQTVTLNINATDSNSYEITNTIKDYSPFEEGTLASKIYLNVKENKNGTILMNTPPSRILLDKSLEKWEGSKETYTFLDTSNMNLTMYGSSDPMGCYMSGNCDDVNTYTGCTSDVEGKYVFDENNFESFIVEKCVDGKIVSSIKQTEKVLSKAPDAYSSSYYFRGDAQDNYVLFNNICWRIVRVQGDGSIKLTLAGEVENGATNCNGVTANSAILNEGNGVEYWYNHYNNTSLKSSLETWFDSKFKSSGQLTVAGNKVKEEKWCLGGTYNFSENSNGDLEYLYKADGTLMSKSYYDEIFSPEFSGDSGIYYAAGYRIVRLKQVSLICNYDEDEITSRVGTLTADEIAYAGGKFAQSDDEGNQNKYYYLYDNAQDIGYWTLSLYGNFAGADHTFVVGINGAFSHNMGMYNTSNVGARPAISLVPGITYTSGEGTIDNPYVVN